MSNVTATMEWKFPAESPVERWPGQLEIRRTDAAEALRVQLARPDSGEVIASADAPGVYCITFAVDHEPSDTGFGTWRVALSQSALVNEPAEVPVFSSSAPISLREPARLWVNCYATSAPITRALLCKTLGADGAGTTFDGLVARHFMANLTHHLGEIARFFLSTHSDDLADNPAAHGLLLAELHQHADEIRTIMLAKFKPDEQREGVQPWDDRLAGWIERQGEKQIAKLVREAGRSAALAGGAAFWAKWLPTQDQPPLRRLNNMALALWRRRVRPRLEREQRPLRFPQPVAHAMLIERPRTVKSLQSRRPPVDIECDDWTSNVLVEKSGVQLILPLDALGATDATTGTTLQSILTGGVLRCYLATWAACADHCNASRTILEGLFPWEESVIHRDYLGASNPKTGRAGGRARELLTRDFEALQKFRVAAVAGARIGTPEPLINFYEHETTGRRIYRHAPAITLFMQDKFAQVPRAVLRLPADDVASALGLAIMMRKAAVSMLQNGNTREGELRELLETCGEDVTGGLRKHGPAAYWPAAAKRLQRICQDGQLGQVRISGQDPTGKEPLRCEGTTVVSVVMNDTLASMYAALGAQSAAHRQRAAKRLPGR